MTPLAYIIRQLARLRLSRIYAWLSARERRSWSEFVRESQGGLYARIRRRNQRQFALMARIKAEVEA